jgi:hypothetical protein
MLSNGITYAFRCRGQDNDQALTGKAKAVLNINTHTTFAFRFHVQAN